LQGIIFSLTLYYISTLLSIPFSLYVDFKIENKYGFNTTTPKLWATDLFKSLIISTILIIIMVSVSCWLIVKLPSLWWLMVWLFTLLFSIFLMYISPYIIEPLFNKFSPAPPQIEEKIKELTERVKIAVSKVMVMDASKRSKHSNAYFTGIGKTKRIVLFDTLLSTMNPSEIISIIAHEAGHWKKKHLLKRIVATELLSLAIIYLSYRILETPFLTSIFEYHNNNFFAKLVLLTFIFSIVFFPFTPLLSFLSRRHETEADNFAISNISNSQDYINALIKLSKDNLINLHPHPFYAKFYYSHPPVLERIEKIKRTAGVKDN
jgi:STE24 endopeptidase